VLGLGDGVEFDSERAQDRWKGHDSVEGLAFTLHMSIGEVY